MKPLLLLHGFTGSPYSFEAVLAALPEAASVLVPVLPGHTGSPVRGTVREVNAVFARQCVEEVIAEPRRSDPTAQSSALDAARSFEACVDALAALLAESSPQPWVVCGYSLGGRLALGLAARHPDSVSSAVLLSAHPGLAPPQRAERALEDRERAARLRGGSIEEFVREWEQHPLLVTGSEVPSVALARQRRIRLTHSPAGLARCLESTGLGVMPDLRASLPVLSPQLILMTGALDTKYCRLADEMAEGVPKGARITLPGCGHNLLLERPHEIADVLRRAIQ